MIRSGNSVRFTPNEVEEFRQVGLDLGNVECQSDIEQEVSRWAHTLADERFELLEKIAWAMAKAKGVKLPPRVLARPADFCMSNLAAKSGLDIFWRQDPVGLS